MTDLTPFVMIFAVMLVMIPFVVFARSKRGRKLFQFKDRGSKVRGYTIIGLFIFGLFALPFAGFFASRWLEDIYNYDRVEAEVTSVERFCVLELDGWEGPAANPRAL